MAPTASSSIVIRRRQSEHESTPLAINEISTLTVLEIKSPMLSAQKRLGFIPKCTTAACHVRTMPTMTAFYLKTSIPHSSSDMSFDR